jgi:hypothetical protein
MLRRAGAMRLISRRPPSRGRSSQARSTISTVAAREAARARPPTGSQPCRAKPSPSATLSTTLSAIVAPATSTGVRVSRRA